ncbi:MAG: hypothetical protein U9R19_03605 [Bacteroidota bacterium]|nr:hypothetical protein [Bacteroidota bacterium]
MVGYTGVLIANNVYASSDQYWTAYFSLKSVMKDPDTTTLIWVDAAGGLLGASCTWGLMGYLMTAAVSHAYVKACEMDETK